MPTWIVYNKGLKACLHGLFIIKDWIVVLFGGLNPFLYTILVVIACIYLGLNPFLYTILVVIACIYLGLNPFLYTILVVIIGLLLDNQS